MHLKKILTAMGLACAYPVLAANASNGIPHLDHVFVIVMENHHFQQILPNPPNPNTPFVNNYALNVASLAGNYYAVGHPSLTNYLEITGGSNFGIRNDNSPDWGSNTCAPALVAGPQLEGSPNICPIAGNGMDAPTPQCDSNEAGAGQACLNNAPVYFPNPAPTVGMSIADQLEEMGMTWKSYQESLPPYGAYGVDNSDGLISDNSVGAQFHVLVPGSSPPSYVAVEKLYAVKHNPFAYFKNVQEHAIKRIVDFSQLYRDLANNSVPNFAFIAPNQCHDQHGRGPSEAGTGCNTDYYDLAQGDAALSNLVTAIKSSPVWTDGGNVALVVVWDENDYTNTYGDNRVVATVDTNYRRSPRVTSAVQYSHFSLLKSIEGGFGLGYLNHAADPATNLMTDLFAR
jgi:hypothetical protein